MKMICGLVFILFLSVCRPGASSAAPAQAAAASATPRVTVSTAAVSAAQAPKPKAVPAVKKNASDDEGEGAVMIDSKSDEDRSGRFSANSSKDEMDTDTEEAPVPGGLPSSYGQLKGTLNDAGKNLLVFESDDGSITFVQVLIGKNAVTWKLVSRIVRSQD